ncbi:MAG TPA: error-prone DNA polymerase [Thermoanaerobaculia bacterium]|nr:error-prone DNA polymerase [Thermoanaerobaculia bacterium]
MSDRDDNDEDLRDVPFVPSRDYGASLERLAASPDARKVKRRERDYRRRPTKLARNRPPPYCELRAASSFSFLDAASQPEDLVERACELGLPAVALVDRNGVYGAPRFHAAAKQAGLKALVGAEVRLEDDSRLTVLARDRTGYRNLSKLLTAAARGRPKGEARANWETVTAHAGGLHCLTGGDEGPLARALAAAGPEAARGLLERIAHTFDGRLHVELQRHRLRDEEHRNRALVELAQRLRLPLVATNGVRYATPEDKPLHDVLTSIREGTTLDAAGRLLACQRERHLKDAAEMAALFADLPQAVAASAELAAECSFTLADLGYRFPDYPLPPGESAASYLRHVTWNEARARFRPLTARAQAQIEHELAVIEKLGLAGYFLIVWDLIRFCKREGIMAQGRGSAANSAVCYALSITAVDPVKMELLFERFLSEERGEWPDVDLDLPSGDQREKVLQYVYRRYGPHGAAMTATVITYRDRSATREVAKVLGYSTDQVDRLAKQLKSFRYDQNRGDDKDFAAEVRQAGLDPEEPRMLLFRQLWDRIHHHPRHLGQHTGGMVIAAGRLDEIVPLEPAAMPGRTVIQWDKDDCQGLGIIKIDLLGLGMLNALEEAVPLIREREGVTVDLAHLPPEDETTYEMIRRADTVGVFQIESRAQMASLPRNSPRRFYDLVVQVAIIRPGPIAGKMVHPYFERRQGRQEVTYPHPSLAPILERTLGVILFQEQILRIAMVAAGFSGGEAEALRRAMGSKRSVEQMERMEGKLRSGMAAKGLTKAAQDQVVGAIRSLALYGFPESHAASFALIAYASAYLKAHHPTAFVTSLLNAWPMGFYHPSSLVKDAQRHGVEVRPIDVARSGWRCRWEDREVKKGTPPGAVRLGLKFVRGLRRDSAAAIEREQRRAPFRDVDELARRTGTRRDELAALAAAGALAGFGLSRRAALWQVERAGRPAGPLLADLPDESPSPLPEMGRFEETLADYATSGITVGAHPLRYLRPRLDAMGVVPAALLDRRRDGEIVEIAGTVIVRQRPGTAGGILFLTLEDETGMSQAIVKPEVLKQQRRLVVATPGVIVRGMVQKKDGTVSVRADRFRSLAEVMGEEEREVAVPSHDFR